MTTTTTTALSPSSASSSGTSRPSWTIQVISTSPKARFSFLLIIKDPTQLKLIASYISGNFSVPKGWRESFGAEGFGFRVKGGKYKGVYPQIGQLVVNPPSLSPSSPARPAETFQRRKRSNPFGLIIPSRSSSSSAPNRLLPPKSLRRHLLLIIAFLIRTRYPVGQPERAVSRNTSVPPRRLPCPGPPLQTRRLHPHHLA